MQYRYHEWTDKILSKRTAESIGSSTLIGLKCGFDVLTIARPSGSNPAKVTISHKTTPSNSITDRLHLSPEQQNTITAVGCVITPDCIITTEDTPLEFNISPTEWNSRAEHAWAVIATHNYIEIPESSTTLQGGSPTTYALVNLMGVITDMGLQQFLDGYIWSDDSGKLIDLVHREDASITQANSVVLGVITNVQAANPSTRNYYLIYDNVTPLLKKVTERDWDNIWVELEDLKYQLETDLLGHINDHNNPHQVTKFQVGLGNLPNSKTSDHTIDDIDILATTAMVHKAIQSYPIKKSVVLIKGQSQREILLSSEIYMINPINWLIDVQIVELTSEAGKRTGKVIKDAVTSCVLHVPLTSSGDHQYIYVSYDPSKLNFNGATPFLHIILTKINDFLIN